MKGIFYATLSGILLGTAGIYGVYMLNVGLTIPEFLFLRFFFVLLMTRGITWKLKQPLRLKKEGMQLALIAALLYGTSATLYYVAAGYLGTGLSMVLFFCYPVQVIFLIWALHEEAPSLTTLASLLVMIVGLFFLIDPTEWISSSYGAALALLAALLFGTYFYFLERYTSTLSVWESTYWVCLGNSAFYLSCTLLQEEITLSLNPTTFAVVLLFAFFSTLLPSLLLLKSFETISSTEASVLSLFDPLVTVFLGWLFLNETFTPLQITGTVLILASLTFFHRQKIPLAPKTISN